MKRSCFTSPVKRTLRFAILLLFPGLIVIPGRAQQEYSDWEFSAQGCIHAPFTAHPDIGNEKLKCRPAAGWNFRIGCRLFAFRKCEVAGFFGRGTTPYWCKVNVRSSMYSQLREDWTTSFYFVHPYLSFGVHLNYFLSGYKKLTVSLSNRFYVSADTKAGIESFDATTSKNMVVFESITTTTGRYFCPEVDFAYASPIVKGYPSWNVELLLAVAPVRVIAGGYDFFPDYPNGSLGYFKLPQSYLGIGIKYRQVKRSK